MHYSLYSDQGNFMKQLIHTVNTLRLRKNGRHFADDIFKCIFLNENVWIPIEISLKSVPKDLINNFPALVQIMAWHRPGDKPLSKSMMVNLLMYVCVTRPQWVKYRTSYALLGVSLFLASGKYHHAGNFCHHIVVFLKLFWVMCPLTSEVCHPNMPSMYMSCKWSLIKLAGVVIDDLV